jgi:nucleoside 2-deoxyribosyltransferase
MIYLAAPYSHPDPKVMEQRFEQVTAEAAHLINRGEFVYSPITHNHPIAIRHELPRGWEFWEAFDIAMLTKCDSMTVLLLDGWDFSRGVRAEIEFARGLGIPITYVEP